ncbi:MAG: hypothetical protein KC492_34460 [Myxococcales bacterium]|nr:hypothetical protein [Myxococcales bacterium]
MSALDYQALRFEFGGVLDLLLSAQQHQAQPQEHRWRYRLYSCCPPRHRDVMPAHLCGEAPLRPSKLP